MIARTRHAQILRRLEQADFLGVEEAAAALGTSATTIRRDFNALARQGVAERMHGGLRRMQGSDIGALPFALRAVQYSTEKAALMREAVRLLGPKDVVMVDGGTTTYHLAACLPEFPVSIITNSMRLATALGERRLEEGQVEVFLTGGYLFPEMGILAGPQTIASLEQYHANWAFLSASGICAEGVFNPNEFVSDGERMMIRNADRVAIVADHSKIGRRSMCRVSGWDEIDVLITTAAEGENETLLLGLMEAGVEVVFAKG